MSECFTFYNAWSLLLKACAVKCHWKHLNLFTWHYTADLYLTDPCSLPHCIMGRQWDRKWDVWPLCTGLFFSGGNCISTCLKISHTGERPPGTGLQIPEHILQQYPAHNTLVPEEATGGVARGWGGKGRNCGAATRAGEDSGLRLGKRDSDLDSMIKEIWMQKKHQWHNCFGWKRVKKEKTVGSLSNSQWCLLQMLCWSCACASESWDRGRLCP